MKARFLKIIAITIFLISSIIVGVIFSSQLVQDLESKFLEKNPDFAFSEKLGDKKTYFYDFNEEGIAQKFIIKEDESGKTFEYYCDKRYITDGPATVVTSMEDIENVKCVGVSENWFYTHIRLNLSSIRELGKVGICCELKYWI